MRRWQRTSPSVPGYSFLYYDNDFRPEYAVDDNNGTSGAPRTTGPAWIQIEPGRNRASKASGLSLNTDTVLSVSHRDIE